MISLEDQITDEHNQFYTAPSEFEPSTSEIREYETMLENAEQMGMSLFKKEKENK